MSRRLFVICLLMTISLFASGLLLAEETETLQKSAKAEVGKLAPWFSGWTMDDQVLSLIKLLKMPSVKKVALVFFAQYCAPCKAEIKQLTKAKDQLKAAGVKVVLVNFQDKPEEVKRFLDGNHVPFPVVLDRFGNTKDVYLETSGPQTNKVILPRTVVIGRDGKVKAIFGTSGTDMVERLIEL